MKTWTWFIRLLLTLLLLYSSHLVECFSDSGSHICQRTCEWPPQPKTCTYKWNVEWFYAMGDLCTIGCDNSTLPNEYNVECQQHPECIVLDGVSRPVNVVNRQLPGPSIQVCEGDTIVVEVSNEMDASEAEGTTLHWHGLLQHMNPYMDGVAMITQCLIEFHQTFTYEFETKPPGTHWWHSHSGSQRADGLFGSLIIRQPAQSDPHSGLYDFDLSEHVIIVTDWYHQTAFRKLTEFTFNSGVVTDPDNILINGKGHRAGVDYNDFTDHQVFAVEKGYRYRFRVIDTGIASCQLKLSIDGHMLTLISTDGHPVQPHDVASIILDGADRYDFIIHADKAIGNYWLKFKGYGDCEGLDARAIIHYQGAGKQIPTSRNDQELIIPDAVYNKCEDSLSEDFVGLMDLDHIGALETPQEVSVTHHIATHLTNRPSQGPTFNRISFRTPESPLLYQWQDCIQEEFCDVGMYTHCAQTTCSCIQTIKVKLNEVVELVFLNEDSATRCHPIHIHGHAFHVVAQQALGESITMTEFKERDRMGLIKRKLHSAPIKDTVHIPQYGYLIVRFIANNLGWWFLHCHTEWHQARGMALVIKSGEDDEIPDPPPHFPRCGSWSPPDVQDFKAGVAAFRSGSKPDEMSALSQTTQDALSASSQTPPSDFNQLDTSTTTGLNLGSLSILLGGLLIVMSSAVVGLLAFIICIKRHMDDEIQEETTYLLEEDQTNIL